MIKHVLMKSKYNRLTDKQRKLLNAKLAEIKNFKYVSMIKVERDRNGYLYVNFGNNGIEYDLRQSNFGKAFNTIVKIDKNDVISDISFETFYDNLIEVLKTAKRFEQINRKRYG